MTERIKLDATSWIEYVTGWLPGPDADELLGKLIADAKWEQRDRWMVNRWLLEPRLTAEYNDLADAPDQRLRAAADRLTSEYGVSYDGLWINFYRDHRDSTGWHGDWPTCKRPVCTVPVLSLGAPRRFLIKPRSGGRSIGFTPRSGDLIVMGGRCQRDWLHSVPKQARPAGPRVSVNFSSRFQAAGAPEQLLLASRLWNRPVEFQQAHEKEKAAIWVPPHQQHPLAGAASRPAGRSSGVPSPARSVTSTRIMPSPTLTARAYPPVNEEWFGTYREGRRRHNVSLHDKPGVPFALPCA